MSLPPLNRLRKGVVAFAFLLLSFVIYRLFFFKIGNDPSPEEELPYIRTEMCLLISSSGEPVNIDTVFNLKSGISRVFAYSALPTDFNTTDTLRHVWYYGTKVIREVDCTLQKSGCVSSVSVDSLQEGNWSLDTRHGNILLAVRQFKIEK